MFDQSPESAPTVIDPFKEEVASMAATDLLEGAVDYDKWVDFSDDEAALALLPRRTN